MSAAPHFQHKSVPHFCFTWEISTLTLGGKRAGRSPLPHLPVISHLPLRMIPGLKCCILSSFTPYTPLPRPGGSSRWKDRQQLSSELSLPTQYSLFFPPPTSLLTPLIQVRGPKVKTGCSFSFVLSTPRRVHIHSENSVHMLVLPRERGW